jgi:signal transduction histidine kinase/ActR/RegA family two-component response regulator
VDARSVAAHERLRARGGDERAPDRARAGLLSRPTKPDRFVAWFVLLVTLNNVHLAWRTQTVEQAIGFYLTQAALGFAGLSFARFWQLTAAIWGGFAVAPIRYGFDAGALELMMYLGAAFALAFAMQTTNFRYRTRLERAQEESERQRLAAEKSLARLCDEVAHREHLQERLARGERLESLGLLAGGVARDFNNLLTVVIGHACRALDRARSGDDRADLAAILDAGERAAPLAKQLLAYAGRSATQAVPVDLEQEVAGVCNLAQSSLPARAVLRLRRSGKELVVRADRGQLQQVVLNLILNAADATESGGVIEVSTGCNRLGEEGASLLEPMQPRPAGNYCFLRVSDSGCGIPEDARSRIFEPFYSTKEGSRGLGLAAALGIARAHRGGFAVESRVGEGSEFTLHLPECGECAAERAKAVEPPQLERDHTILVVDDQAPVRRMLAGSLQRSGDRVVEAAGGLEAEQRLHASSSEIAAAIVDMSMPEVDGEQTLARLRAIRPELPILLSSGFDAHEAAVRLMQLPGVRFLAKPYRIAELRQQLAELIDRNAEH